MGAECQHFTARGVSITNENMKFVQFKTVSLTQESVLNHCQNHLHVLEIKKIYQSSVNNVNLLVLKLVNVIYIENKHTPDKTNVQISI